LQAAIRNLEGKLKVAQDHAAFHRQRADQYDRDVTRFQTAVEAIYEVIGGPVDVAIADSSGVAYDGADFAAVEAAVVFDDGQEAPAEPSHPFQGNGRDPVRTPMFDRDMVKRELRARHIYYPVAKSHRNFSTFLRQSLVSACVEHANYKGYLAGGGIDLTQRNRRLTDVRDACVLLGIDQQRVTDDARMLHNLLYAAGTPGQDFL